MAKERVKVWGAPGTGKTSFLLDIVNRELEEGLYPWDIIYTSFTRASCNETINRALQRFQYNKQDFPFFKTEHSICFRLLGLRREQVFTRRHLGEFGKRYNYSFSGDSAEPDSLEGRYQEAMLQTLADFYEFFVTYMENKMMPFNDAYREFVRSNTVPDGFTRNGLGHYIERRIRYKDENRLWSFNDMIIGCLQQGLFPEGVKVLILDEAQDCSKSLWELIRFWSTRVESYYIAGDPLQTLYFWSGSSPELFFGFPGEEEVLSHSYRLTPEVKDYAERVVVPTGLPFPKFEPSQRQGSVSRKSFYSIDWQNVGDAFLLVRTRWLISQIVDYFISMGIPFVSERGRQSPLAKGTGRAFLALLKLVDGEQVSDIELRNLIKYTRIPFLERGAKARIRKLMEGMYRKWELGQMGFTSAFMEALYGNFTDVLCQDVDDWEKAYLHRIYRKNGREVFERESQLRVLTYHAAKGREASQVYLCPDYTTTVWESFLKGGGLSERLLSYVGITRAVDNLIILLPQRDFSFPYPRINAGGGK